MQLVSQVCDDILLLILNKINTSEAVKTTFLSKRWKNLWRSLPSLRLHVSLPAADSLSLPNLKTLRLQTRLLFADDRDAVEPFSGLPELEKLMLVGPTIGRLVVIKSPKLRVLEIEGCYHLDLDEVSAPLLTTFRYQHYLAWKCSKVNLPMLEQVYLDIHCIRPFLHDTHTYFGKMFRQFGNATEVSLTLDTLEILSRLFNSFEQTPPPFPNIKVLKVMEGRHEFSTVLQRVIDHLTRSSNCEVELSPGLCIAEERSIEDNHIFRKLNFEFN